MTDWFLYPSICIIKQQKKKQQCSGLFNHYVELWDDVSRLGKLLVAEKATVTCGIFSTSTSSCFCFLHGLLVLHTWIHVILGFKETKEFVSPRQFAFEAKTQIDPPRLIGCQEIVKYHASTSFSNASVATMVIRENRVFNYRSNSYRKWLAITLSASGKEG